MSEKSSIKGVLCDRFGKETRVATLKDVLYMPGNAFNLLSVSKLIDGGWEVSGNKSGYVITKNGVQLVFDIAVQMPSTTLWAMYLKRSGTVVGTETGAMTIDQAHNKLGHCNDDMCRKIAKDFGWKIKPGAMKPCEACSAAKAKQKNVVKHSEREAPTEITRFDPLGSFYYQETYGFGR
jgi:hypothetical protein